jgi:parallel beta-helix repeat protein
MLRSIALAFVLAAPPLAATTYYVAPPPTGSNSQPGTQAQPWATLQHAADTIRAGDTVRVRAGSYSGAYFTASGTSAQPIVLEAYSGETVQIVADNPQTPDGINLEGASWMTVQGFTVNGRTRAGIRAVTCHHVTLRNNRMDQNGRWGILTGFCDDLLIEGNVASRSVAEHGIYVSNSADRPVIRGNTCWGNRANGIHMNGDIASGGGDGIISEAVVEANTIYDNGVGGGGSGINMDGVQNSLIRNNLIHSSHASGISIYRVDGGGASSGNRVLNNTVLVASNGRWALNIQNGSTGTIVRNNILLNAHAYRGSIDISADSLPGLNSDYNVLMDRLTTSGGNSVLTLPQWRQQTAQDAHSRVATAAQLFVNVAANDYRLSATSPALNAGQARADVPTDIAGVARPQGASHDIGAYERTTNLVFTDGFESAPAQLGLLDAGSVRWNAESLAHHRLQRLESGLPSEFECSLGREALVLRCGEREQGANPVAGCAVQQHRPLRVFQRAIERGRVGVVEVGRAYDRQAHVA